MAVSYTHLDVYKRQVVGANGAGKSTLVKVLAGADSTYTGDVLLNGKKVKVRTPVDAKKLGIQIVYQEVDMALYPTLSVAEDVYKRQHRFLISFPHGLPLSAG